MRIPSQLPLPLASRPALSRADLIVTPANASAVAFIDAWPDWPVATVVLYGPAGCGKSHLVSIWQDMTGARVLAASRISREAMGEGTPLAIEDVDSEAPKAARDGALFAALESATQTVPLLLTGREPPSSWACTLPDLASRFAALASFPVWAPDEELLGALARKLFAERQIPVPDAVIARMLLSLERSPRAIRDFVTLADAEALAQARPLNLALVRELLAAPGMEPP